jgi:hypothetical protein
MASRGGGSGSSSTQENIRKVLGAIKDSTKLVLSQINSDYKVHHSSSCLSLSFFLSFFFFFFFFFFLCNRDYQLRLLDFFLSFFLLRLLLSFFLSFFL